MNIVAANPVGRRERGVVAIIVVILLPLLIGFIGIALDMNRLYSRRIELQTAVDAIAVAAAAELDGTPAGILQAETAAYGAARNLKVNYSSLLRWREKAITFGTKADDTVWKDLDGAQDTAVAPSLGLVKIDAKYLTAATTDNYPFIPSEFQTTLIQLITPGTASVTLDVQAIAGKLEANVLPLAVCALNNTEKGSHANYNGVAADTLEYGFRRGVNYNLLDQSPTTKARLFLVNPLDAASGASQSKHFDAANIGPFMCAGTVATGAVHAKGLRLHVKEIDPAAWGAQLATWLNSRFEVYSGDNACNRSTAPPDTNVKEFTGDYMKVRPDKASSLTVTRNAASRESVANLVSGDTTADTVTEAGFGPLWTFAQPVKASGSGGYSASQWPSMYKFGSVAVQASAAYPATPYSTQKVAPSGGAGVSGRRVLNVPLLDCATWTGSGAAPVLAIGKFFMPAKADSNTLPGEFAGITQQLKLVRKAVLVK